MPDPEQMQEPMSGCPDASNVEILQHINAMLDNPLDLSEGLSRGPSRDGKETKAVCSGGWWVEGGGMWSLHVLWVAVLVKFRMLSLME
jgi:hypothetical protein